MYMSANQKAVSLNLHRYIEAGQVREAALRLLLDIAKCVDFEQVPKVRLRTVN